MEKGNHFNSHYATRLLRRLDAELLKRGCSFEGIVVGRAAAIFLSRAKGAEGSSFGESSLIADGCPFVELLFPPFADYLQDAALSVARAEAIEAGWLRAGPPRTNTLYSTGQEIPLELPDGWRSRVVPLVFCGAALHLHAPGRCDLIALEVAESSRGTDRSRELALLAPDEEEQRWANRWLAEHGHP